MIARSVPCCSISVAVFSVVTIAATCGATYAQGVRATQDGRSLDRNPAVGFGGYNIARPEWSAINGANRYITGNVTGLGAFHGASPIQDSSLFRAGLGSSGLSFFQRQSVGIQDVLGNRTQSGMPYYGRSETIVNAGGIAAGRNVPGSSIPLNYYTPPQPNPRRSPATPDPLERDPLTLRNRGELLSPYANVRIPSSIALTSYNADDLARNAASPYAAAVGSTLFGTDYASDRNAQPPRLNTVKSSGGGLESGKTTPMKNAPAGGPESSKSAAPAQDLPRVGTPVNLGEDRFTDVYNAVRYAKSFQDGYLENRASQRVMKSGGPSALASVTNALSATLRERLRAPTEYDVRNKADLDQFNRAAAWAKKLLDEPIRSFAGEAPTDVNQCFADGERALVEGRYYEAADRFALAQKLDPDNPLADLAHGHALAAAGDYSSAVRQLEAGLRRFPEAAALAIDLNALLGGSSVVEARCADLERLLASNDNADLRFLLGYLQYYSGKGQAGIGHIMQAAKSAPRDSIIRDMPRLMLGAGATDEK